MLSILKNSAALRKCIVPSRSYHYIGRPREQLSIAETWAHGLAIVGGILAIPVWVLCHVKHYRGIDK